MNQFEPMKRALQTNRFAKMNQIGCFRR